MQRLDIVKAQRQCPSIDGASIRRHIQPRMYVEQERFAGLRVGAERVAQLFDEAEGHGADKLVYQSRE